ncbi:16385_t:CDS:2 [Acaulospora morrowiae]|uniref:16385_t:CDS:1 n=1 Tax=Acaulospora morrowiae TaxID=94023 RepID=A0A9N9F8S4_9GLOM|nr:16385_t:CDS:2 [Acaulospora morrowiae]
MREYDTDNWKYWDTIIIVIMIAHFFLVMKKIRGAREAVMAVITIMPLILKKPTKLDGTEPTIKPYLSRRTSNSMDDELQ